jgi:uncharacterized membrane protein (UPF0127 family)
MCLLAASPAAAVQALDSAFARDVAVVVASEHACYRFDVYLATNNRQRARGLMHVRELPPMTGMLFIYDADGYLSMWMKNTYIPLDILFIRKDGTISSIARDTEPLSLRSLVSTEPVRFVLELNAGSAQRLAIDENSRLIWEPANARQSR